MITMEPLNEEERKFAEENHNLIYSFLNQYRLPVEEWYGIAALGYLQGVKNYDPNKKSFSAFVYRCMLNAVRMEMRRNRLRNQWHNGIVSMDITVGHSGEITVKDLIPDKDGVDSLVEYNEYIRRINTLPKKVKAVVILLMQGYSQKEISEILGHSQPYISKLVNRARGLIERNTESRTP